MPVTSMRATEAAAYSDFLKAFGAPPGHSKAALSTPVQQHKTLSQNSPGIHSNGLTASDPTTPTTVPHEKPREDESYQKENEKQATKEKDKKSKRSKTRVPPHLRVLLMREGQQEARVERRQLEAQLRSFRYSAKATGGHLNDRRIVPHDEAKRHTTWIIQSYCDENTNNAEGDAHLRSMQLLTEERFFSSGWYHDTAVDETYYNDNDYTKNNVEEYNYTNDNDNGMNINEDNQREEDTDTAASQTRGAETIATNTQQERRQPTSHNPYIRVPITNTMPPPPVHYDNNHSYNTQYDNYNNYNNYYNNHPQCYDLPYTSGAEGCDSRLYNKTYTASDSGSLYVPESCSDDNSDKGAVSDWE